MDDTSGWVSNPWCAEIRHDSRNRAKDFACHVVDRGVRDRGKHAKIRSKLALYASDVSEYDPLHSHHVHGVVVVQRQLRQVG